MIPLLALLAVGCGTDKAPAADTAPDPEVDACEVETPGGGTAAGELRCADEICEIPAGEFVMGTANPDIPDECPPRRVTLSAFSIDQYEVTQARWAACVDAGACAPRDETCRSMAHYVDEDQLPVVCVTHAQAADFCAWAGGRLPSEAEWEKAARGTDGARWPWGSEAPTCLLANHRFVVAYCEGGVIDVGSYAAMSPFGLYDTSGNAWEWVADAYDAAWYRDGPTEDPPGPTRCRSLVDAEPGDCDFRVIRGGAFNTAEDTTRAANRDFAPPTVADVNIGFRCAYSAATAQRLALSPVR